MAEGKCVPCKLGTVPALVVLDRRFKLAAGRRVRVQVCVGARHDRHAPWEYVRVTRVDSGGYFFADK